MENENKVEEVKQKKKKAPKKTTPKVKETVETKTLSEIKDIEIVEELGLDEGAEEIKTEGFGEIFHDESIVTPVVVEEIQIEDTIMPIIDESSMQIVEQIDIKLSSQAQKWADWLKYQKISPEKLLERYPTHKYKHFIEEIIAFEAKK